MSTLFLFLFLFTYFTSAVNTVEANNYYITTTDVADAQFTTAASEEATYTQISTTVAASEDGTTPACATINFNGAYKSTLAATFTLTTAFDGDHKFEIDGTSTMTELLLATVNDLTAIVTMQLTFDITGAPSGGLTIAIDTANLLYSTHTPIFNFSPATDNTYAVAITVTGTTTSQPIKLNWLSSIDKNARVTIGSQYISLDPADFIVPAGTTATADFITLDDDMTAPATVTVGDDGSLYVVEGDANADGTTHKYGLSVLQSTAYYIMLSSTSTTMADSAYFLATGKVTKVVSGTTATSISSYDDATGYAIDLSSNAAYKAQLGPVMSLMTIASDLAFTLGQSTTLTGLTLTKNADFGGELDLTKQLTFNINGAPADGLTITFDIAAMKGAYTTSKPVFKFTAASDVYNVIITATGTTSQGVKLVWVGSTKKNARVTLSSQYISLAPADFIVPVGTIATADFITLDDDITAPATVTVEDGGSLYVVKGDAVGTTQHKYGLSVLKPTAYYIMLSSTSTTMADSAYFLATGKVTNDDSAKTATSISTYDATTGYTIDLSSNTDYNTQLGPVMSLMTIDSDLIFTLGQSTTLTGLTLTKNDDFGGELDLTKQLTFNIVGAPADGLTIKFDLTTLGDAYTTKVPLFKFTVAAADYDVIITATKKEGVSQSVSLEWLTSITNNARVTLNSANLVLDADNFVVPTVDVCTDFITLKDGITPPETAKAGESATLFLVKGTVVSASEQTKYSLSRVQLNNYYVQVPSGDTPTIDAAKFVVTGVITDGTNTVATQISHYTAATTEPQADAYVTVYLDSNAANPTASGYNTKLADKLTFSTGIACEHKFMIDGKASVKTVKFTNDPTTYGGSFDLKTTVLSFFISGAPSSDNTITIDYDYSQLGGVYAKTITYNIASAAATYAVHVTSTDASAAVATHQLAALKFTGSMTNAPTVVVGTADATNVNMDYTVEVAQPATVPDTGIADFIKVPITLKDTITFDTKTSDKNLFLIKTEGTEFVSYTLTAKSPVHNFYLLVTDGAAVQTMYYASDYLDKLDATEATKVQFSSEDSSNVIVDFTSANTLAGSVAGTFAVNQVSGDLSVDPGSPLATTFKFDSSVNIDSLTITNDQTLSSVIDITKQLTFNVAGGKSNKLTLKFDYAKLGSGFDVAPIIQIVYGATAFDVSIVDTKPASGEINYALDFSSADFSTAKFGTVTIGTVASDITTNVKSITLPSTLDVAKYPLSGFLKVQTGSNVQLPTALTGLTTAYLVRDTVVADGVSYVLSATQPTDKCVMYVSASVFGIVDHSCDDIATKQFGGIAVSYVSDTQVWTYTFGSANAAKAALKASDTTYTWSPMVDSGKFVLNILNGANLIYGVAAGAYDPQYTVTSLSIYRAYFDADSSLTFSSFKVGTPLILDLAESTKTFGYKIENNGATAVDMTLNFKNAADNAVNPTVSIVETTSAISAAVGYDHVLADSLGAYVDSGIHYIENKPVAGVKFTNYYRIAGTDAYTVRQIVAGAYSYVASTNTLEYKKDDYTTVYADANAAAGVEQYHYNDSYYLHAGMTGKIYNVPTIDTDFKVTLGKYYAEADFVASKTEDDGTAAPKSLQITLNQTADDETTSVEHIIRIGYGVKTTFVMGARFSEGLKSTTIASTNASASFIFDYAVDMDNNTFAPILLKNVTASDLAKYTISAFTVSNAKSDSCYDLDITVDNAVTVTLPKDTTGKWTAYLLKVSRKVYYCTGTAKPTEAVVTSSVPNSASGIFLALLLALALFF